MGIVNFFCNVVPEEQVLDTSMAHPDFESIVKIIERLDPAVRICQISNAMVLNELLYMLKTGLAWRYMRPHKCSYHVSSNKRGQSFSNDTQPNV